MSDQAVLRQTPVAAAAPNLQPWLVRLGFMLGALGPSLGFQLVIVLMLRFMTDSLAIPAAVAGGLLAATRIFDAIVDPLIGWASDKTRTRIGRRRPWFLAGAVLLPISAAALFNVPIMAAGATEGFLALFLIMNAVGYSAFTVPYVASVAEIAGDYHERSVLMSFRIYGQTFGLMLASSVAPWLLAAWGAGRAAHGKMAWIMAAVLMASLALAVRLIPEPAADARVQPKLGFGRRVALAWDNKPFRLVILAHIGFQIGVGAVLVTTAYFSRQVLHVSDVWLGAFFLSKTIGNLVSVHPWLWIAKRFDKKATFVASLIAYGLLNLSWMVAGAGEPMAVMFGRMFLIGVAMGGCILMQSAVIADVIRYDSVRTGLNQGGTFSGVASFVDKSFQAAGVALVGYLLSSMGYVATTHGAHVQQSPSAITAIYIGFSVIPAVAACACVLAMWGYRLKREDFEA
jgi:GPH family glycoside/pentoside/hexuronide:cation symporter